MKLNEDLLQLSKQGALIRLFRAGHISYRVVRDVDIFLTFLTHYTTDEGKEKGKKSRAVQATAVQFNCSDDNVWKILQRLNEV